jgi:two-component system, NarL family, nitrate/nitrite response regulator NarL
MSDHATRVALVEDHVLLAESMYLALSAEGFATRTVTVPPDAEGVAEMLDPILDHRPDVVLLDLDLGAAGDGTALVRPLTNAGCAVVVVTGASEKTRWGKCLANGARTVLPKAASLDVIVDTVRRAASGEAVMPEARRYELIQNWQRQRSDNQDMRTKLGRLTPREEEVLAALSEGKRVRDIASEWYVSEATVRTQVKSVLAKLGVTSQIAAVAFARELDWRPAG